MDPNRIVSIEDFSDATLRNIVAHLDASIGFEHFIYREAELDEVCRLLLLTIETNRAAPADQRARWQAVFEAARDAHDLVAEEKPDLAADRLREILSYPAGPGDRG